MRLLLDRLGNRRPERDLITDGERPEPPDDKPLFQCCKHRLDGRGFEQSGGLPLSDPAISS